jgi:hypothetical protein
MSKTKSERVVAFANDITIIEFPMVLGDNPSVSSGVPVQIGWVPQATTTRNLNLYEHFKEESKRNKKSLVLKVPDRASILLRAGYPLESIVRAAMTADMIRQSRLDNLIKINNKNNNNKKQGWERLGTVIKSVKNMVQPRSVPAKTA